MDLSERNERMTGRHPWETARAEFFVRLLSDDGLLQGTSRWLDVGAGDGWLTSELAEAASPDAQFDCWDINYADDQIRLLDARAAPNISFVAQEPQGRYDVVLMLDVIEHVPDDGAFLAHVVQEHTHPGSAVLVSVPAWPGLFSQHDVALKHFRRYSPREARRVLRGAGLEIRLEGGLFSSLLAPRGMQVLAEKLGRRASSDGVGAWNGGAGITTVVDALLRSDSAVSRQLSRRGLAVPGLSYWALTRVP